MKKANATQKANPAPHKPSLAAIELEARLWVLLTQHVEGIPLPTLGTLLPSSDWRHHATKLSQLLDLFPNTVVVTGKAGSGREKAELAWPVLLRTLKTDVATLLTKWPNEACSVDSLVEAYSKLKNNADLDVLAKLAGYTYLEDLLEDQGFSLSWVGDMATIHATAGKKPAGPSPGPAASRTPTKPTSGAAAVSKPTPKQSSTGPSSAAATSQPAPPTPTTTESPAREAVQIVADVERCREVVQSILAHDHPLALDCEGVDLGDRSGSLCLVQIATRSGRCFLFDVTAGGSRLFSEGGLRRVLEDVHVLKVGHDLRADASALFADHGVLLNHVFDTQVGHSVLTMGKQSQVGLNPMLKLYAKAQNELKKVVKKAWTRDQLYWTRRPLTEEMVGYASLDVAFLLQAFDSMAAALEQQGLFEHAAAASRLYIDRRRFPTATGAGAPAPRGEEREITRECHVTQENESIDEILNALPERLRDALLVDNRLHGLVEIVLDLGRPLMARFSGAGMPRMAQIGDVGEINETDLQHVLYSITDFDSENRAGLSRTLHRVSRLQNRSGQVVGLTIRVGKTISGLVGMVADVLQLAAERKASILLLGSPGMGKTSVLREMARELAKEWSVMIVDTSNEIAGAGDIPHPAIGAARRMQVFHALRQHKCMLEAVQNHTPDIVIVDEIGTKEEAAACSTIARRGVMLVATAHGVTLQDVVDNPGLNSIVGGVASVTLSDEVVRERRAKTKTVRECKGPSAFAMAIELRSRREWVVHHDVRANVELMLNGEPVVVELRRRLPDGRVVATKQLFDDIQLQPDEEEQVEDGEDEETEEDEEEGWVSVA